jgi:hypothetical protein
MFYRINPTVKPQGTRMRVGSYCSGMQLALFLTGTTINHACSGGFILK